MALQNYIEDDWGDNSLTGRTSAEKDVFYQYSDGGTGDLLKGVYRPEWTTRVGSPSAANGRLEIPAGSSTSQVLNTASTLPSGTWTFDYQQTGTSTLNYNTFVSFFFDRPTNDYGGSGVGYAWNMKTNGNSWRLIRRDTASQTALATGTPFNDTSPHSVKNTRDSYGNFEIFHDGTSVGTATDETYFEEASIMHIGSNMPFQVQIDNLVIQ